MTLARDLLDALPGIPIGGDDPSVLQRWTGGRDIEDAAYDVIAGLPDLDALAVLDAMREPTFAGLLACSDRHPYLRQLCAWVAERPELVLVAAPTGPTPPAVLVLERDMTR